MRAAIYAIILFLGFMLESTVLPFFQIHGVKPDLILVFVICLGVFNGKEQAALVGLAGGLLQDIVTGKLLGLHALTKMLVGYLCGYAAQQVFKENAVVPVAAVFLGTIANELLNFFLSAHYYQLRVPLGTAFLWLILPVAVYNSVIGPLGYWLVRKINMRLNPAQYKDA